MKHDSYDLISVNWNLEQTEAWLASALVNAPGATVGLIRDKKPLPWCWSGGKLGFEDFPFTARRAIYTDTDVLFLRPLELVWDLMPKESFIGVTHYTEWHGCTKEREQRHIMAGGPVKKAAAYQAFGLSPDAPYRHYSSGMLVFRDPNPRHFYRTWMAACNLLKDTGFPSNFRMFEEVALSLLLMKMGPTLVWKMPLSIHNNILNSTPRDIYDAEEKIPIALHYHKRARIAKHDLLTKKTRRFF